MLSFLIIILLVCNSVQLHYYLFKRGKTPTPKNSPLSYDEGEDENLSNKIQFLRTLLEDKEQLLEQVRISQYPLIAEGEDCRMVFRTEQEFREKIETLWMEVLDGGFPFLISPEAA